MSPAVEFGRTGRRHILPARICPNLVPRGVIAQLHTLCKAIANEQLTGVPCGEAHVAAVVRVS